MAYMHTALKTDQHTHIVMCSTEYLGRTTVRLEWRRYYRQDKGCYKGIQNLHPEKAPSTQVSKWAGSGRCAILMIGSPRVFV